MFDDMFSLISFLTRLRGIMSGLVHIWKAFLSHTMLRLIPIRAGRDHKDDKVLQYNTVSCIPKARTRDHWLGKERPHLSHLHVQ